MFGSRAIEDSAQRFCHLKPIKITCLLIELFFSCGLVIVLAGINSLLQNGSYFIGTPSQLINYRRGTMTSPNWNKFTDDIEIYIKEDLGRLVFTLNTHKDFIHSDSDSTYDSVVYDKIYMVGIADVFKIEKKCRIRIIEAKKKQSDCLLIQGYLSKVCNEVSTILGSILNDRFTK
jgi:hypothetical protein